MREIKFRIRLKNKQTGEITTLFNPIFDEGIGVAWWQINKDIFELLSADEWTGLRDKNGKERYAGDIIRRWTGYVFVEKIRDYSLGLPNGANVLGYDYHKDDEIIGNIYEHPHLLSDKEQP